MPQPVDLQTEVARMTAVERMQTLTDRASLAAQQRQEVSAEEDRIVSETQVQETNEPENREVDADGRRRNPFVGRRRRRKHDGDKDRAGVFYNDEEREELADEAAEGRSFDVTI